MIGQVVGHFRIEGTLGQGGMGVVYRAHDERLRRTVALKLLPAEWAQDATARARLLREARAAAAVTHQNIATVYEVGEDSGRVFIAMEAIEGRTLRSLLVSGRLPLEETLRICREIARGVARAHEKGIVHRDLKPENVMITDEGDVKVLDFGLARQSEPVDASATKPADNLSTPGTLVGTPAYMSPEQAMGQTVDARSDVFSLGLILYELAAGQHPFTGTNPVGVAVAIVRDDPPPASSVNAEIPAALERTIATCLAKRPRDRYSTARDLLRDLELLAPHRSSGATRPVPRPHQRQRAIVLASAAALALLAAGVAIWSPRTSSTPAPAPAPAPAPRSALTQTERARAAMANNPPKSSSPEAVRIYQEGRQAWYDGRWGASRDAFEKALKLDPTLAPVLLRLGLDPSDEGREYFRRAAANRASLDEIDQARLHAWEPVIQRDPADETEAVRRMRALARRFPEDPEVVADLAHWLSTSADVPPEARVAETSAAAALVPNSGARAAALSYLQLGKVDEALAVLGRCVEQNPSSAYCLASRGDILASLGRCTEAEAVARRVLTIEPDTIHGLADVLLAQQNQHEAAREILRKANERLPERDRAPAAALDDTTLALISGDFTTAIARFKALQELIKNEREEQPHAEAAGELARIYEEIGRPEEARRVARSFLNRRAAYEPHPTRSEEAVVADPTGVLLAVERRAGGLSSEQHRAQLQARLEWWNRRLGQSWLRHYVWETQYANAVQTAAEASEAMQARPRFGRAYAPGITFMHDLAAIGRTYLLAGRVDEALPLLERAANSCEWLTAVPLEHVRASFFLGEARAAKGDKAGACAAYDKLLERWGKARPRSLTADKTRARRAALGCGS